MEKEKLEEQIMMELVVNSGNARSTAMEAITCAEEGEIEKAEKMILEARKQIEKAHSFQTELVTKEAAGESVSMSLLMCHGQDHLMTAMVIIDLAERFVQVYKKIK